MTGPMGGMLDVMVVWACSCWLAFMSIAELIVGIVSFTYWDPDNGHDLYFGLGVGFIVTGAVSSLCWLGCMCHKRWNGNTLCEDIC
jgi:hypothetical protein